MQAIVLIIKQSGSFVYSPWVIDDNTRATLLYTAGPPLRTTHEPQQQSAYLWRSP
jgi:hypothetical protein